jgi:hypothetical protein
MIHCRANKYSFGRKLAWAGFGIAAVAGAWVLGLMHSPQVRAQSAPTPPAPTQSAAPRIQLTPSEIDLYNRASTLIDWTPRQIRGSPFLRGVRLAGNPDPLPSVLERVGQTATLLFNNFTQVSCDEEVLSAASLLDPRQTHGILHYPTMDRKFRYIVIPLPGDGLPGFEEYRTDLKGTPRNTLSPGDLHMLTSNFASTWLYLRPADQRNTRFRYFGTQTIRNHECHVVGFAQDPMRVYRAGEILIHGKGFAMLVQGLAWIDSVTFQVLRMTTWLLAPRTDIGLSSQISTVDFYAVKPTGSEKVLWLPRDVTVEIDYHDLEISNTHHYSNFKLFRVESTIKTGG